MKIIVISALALGLTAFGARAQQSTSNMDDPNKGTSPSTSTAQPGTPAAGDAKSQANLPENGDKKVAAHPGQDENSSGAEVKKSKKQRGQARSSTSVRHRARTMPQNSSSQDVPPSGDRENATTPAPKDQPK